jgi:hypothetical protein
VRQTLYLCSNKECGVKEMLRVYCGGYVERSDKKPWGTRREQVETPTLQSTKKAALNSQCPKFSRNISERPSTNVPTTCSNIKISTFRYPSQFQNTIFYSRSPDNCPTLTWDVENQCRFTVYHHQPDRSLNGPKGSTLW